MSHLPLPATISNETRRAIQALRRRLLTGAWKQDLLDTLRDQLGVTRTDAIRTPDMSGNAFADICTQLSTLYDEDPTPTHPDAPAAAAMAAALVDAGFTPTMQSLQRLTLGIRDMFLLPEIVAGSLTFREIYPDTVRTVKVDRTRPGQIVRIEEEVDHAGQACVLVIDSEAPQLSVTRLRDGADLTEEYFGRLEKPYPWLRPDGKPYMPVVAYHAQLRGAFWDPLGWEELVSGTLNAGSMTTQASHAFRHVAFPQRWISNGAVASNDVNGRSEVIADPTTVLMIDQAEGSNSPPTVGQWQPGADPQAMMDAVLSYEGRLGTKAGIAAADVVRQSGDPRSGYALMLSMDGRRRAQGRYKPAFRRSDRILLSVVATMLNLPSEGWDIVYTAIPPTPDELAAKEQLRVSQQARILALRDGRLINDQEARRLLGLQETPP